MIFFSILVSPVVVLYSVLFVNYLIIILKKINNLRRSITHIIDVQEEKKEEAKEIQGLKILASPIIQEKLYTEEMCLAPKQLLETLTSDDDVQSKPFLKNNIHQLLMEKPSANN